MGTILFLHGMGSHGKDFWRDWTGNLLPELAAQGLLLREENCRGIFYDDLVPHETGFTDQLARVRLNSRLKSMAISEFGQYRGFLSGAKLAVHKWSEAVVDNFGDIFTYLYWAKTHRAVNERVYEALAGAEAPVTLVGYSLGSLVGYCAMQENLQAAAAVGHLIMVGSPLFWFSRGVAGHVNLRERPQVARFTNLAGIWDIAWPQKVPGILAGLDENVVFFIDPADPIGGHQKYFYDRNSLSRIAAAVVSGWADDSRQPA